jgi:hypothetical protein
MVYETQTKVVASTSPPPLVSNERFLHQQKTASFKAVFKNYGL